MAQILQSYGSLTLLASANFVGLSSSATAVWQSQLVDIASTDKAIDYDVFIRTAMTTAAPASDKALYVFVIPWSSGSATWLAGDLGTTTFPTGTEGTATINSSSVLKMLGVMSYVTAGQVVHGKFNLLNAFGSSLPDGFSLVIENFSGTPISTTSFVSVRPISETVA